MKKSIVLILVTAMCFAIGCQLNADKQVKPASKSLPSGNYSDEMKIPYGTDLSEWGPDSVERQGDHKDSPYFTHLDFYNMDSTENLTILSKFQTIQQTSEWSCGVTCILMVMNHYGLLGEHDEASLAALRPNGLNEEATNLRQAMTVFDEAGGFQLTTTFDLMESENAIDAQYMLEAIQAYLKQDIPIMICWNEWGGHWQVIIGYDTMGTESILDDVLIVADPYDTSDHNQDGYGVYSASRFIYNFSTYNLFPEEELNNMLFIIAEPLDD